MNQILFLLSFLFGVNSFAKVMDSANLLDEESLNSINVYSWQIQQNHKSKVVIKTVDSISSKDKDAEACKFYDQFNLSTIDVLILVSKSEPQSVMCVGSYADDYLTKEIQKEIFYQTLTSYDSKNFYEALNITLKVIEREYKKGKEKQDGEVASDLGFTIMGFLGVVFAIAILASILTPNSTEHTQSYVSEPHERPRDLTMDNFNEYKIEMVKILMAKYPDESLYHSYKRVVKEYKRNIKFQQITHAEGHFEIYDRTGLSQNSELRVPYYFEMYNSAHLPKELVDCFIES
jgi:hypothetical protein